MKKGLRRLMDRFNPLFVKGGPYEKYYVVFEMVDGFLYTLSTVNRAAPHIRDGADLKRVMTFVVIGVLPCTIMAMYNTGFQANLAMLNMGIESAPGWRGDLLEGLGIGYSPASIWACTWHGFLYFFPIYLVSLGVGGIWELVFAAVRNHEINEGALMTTILFALVVPATTPLWQVALGISFGIVLGKEVFGGTGKNFLNPALTGRAFLYFAFPAQHSGNAVWTAVDGFSGATALSLAAEGGVSAIQEGGITWLFLWPGPNGGIDSIVFTKNHRISSTRKFDKHIRHHKMLSNMLRLGGFTNAVSIGLLLHRIGCPSESRRPIRRSALAPST